MAFFKYFLFFFKSFKFETQVPKENVAQKKQAFSEQH